MFETKSIRGFYMIEELAVNGIYHISVLPHIHAIIDADTLEAEEVQEKVLHIKSASEAKFERTLPIDVDIKPISSQRCLMDKIGYMFKPIEFVKAYERDWLLHENKVRLNSNTTDLVVGYSHVNYRRSKMTYKGTLNSRCREFIGISKNDRAQYKHLLRQIQREAYENYIESTEPSLN